MSSFVLHIWFRMKIENFYRGNLIDSWERQERVMRCWFSLKSIFTIVLKWERGEGGGHRGGDKITYLKKKS